MIACADGAGAENGAAQNLDPCYASQSIRHLARGPQSMRAILDTTTGANEFSMGLGEKTYAPRFAVGEEGVGVEGFPDDGGSSSRPLPISGPFRSSSHRN